MDSRPDPESLMNMDPNQIVENSKLKILFLFYFRIHVRVSDTKSLQSCEMFLTAL